LKTAPVSSGLALGTVSIGSIRKRISLFITDTIPMTPPASIIMRSLQSARIARVQQSNPPLK
jgi:hypothetical protein